MNVNYINPFINACIDVFKTFAGLSSEPGKPVARLHPAAPGDVKGIIGLNGHGISGYFIISFYGPFLEKVTATLFGLDAVSSQEELNDLAGELTNMISGNAKAELSKRGFFFDVAVPRITHGTPKIPPALAKNPVIMVPFSTTSGQYAIEASLKETRAGKPGGQNQQAAGAADGSMSVEAFAKASGLTPAKVKNFLRTGFLKGTTDAGNTWRVNPGEIQKFKNQKNN